ncbi:MAG: hypothetical protein K1X67_24845 [Fimbriimonadaceae bacterium]|nr:hypothetical protein [Fimbriimonadaceae bacterium]
MVRLRLFPLLAAFIAIASIPAFLLLRPKSPGEKPEGPDRAWAWRRLAWVDENGNLDHGAYLRSLAQRDAMLEAGGEAGIQATTWVERGPDNVGGRTRSLAIHPTNPNILLAGSVGGGIWRSSNGGTNWTPVDDRLRSLAIGCIVFDPTNANIVYAGTGEGHFNGDAIGGVGIYKSTDGGLTFSHLPSTVGWDNVCDLAISPNGTTILASKRYGGIQRSTNGGASWSNPYWAQGSFCVEFDPTNSSKAIAQVIDYDFGVGNWFHRALYSTNGGANWNVAGGLGQLWNFDSRIEIKYARSNPSICYASVAQNGGKVWKSTDGGVNYALVTTTGSSGCNWYANPLWVDPTNPNNLVVGGYHLFRSANGGVNLSQISDGYIQTTQPHPDQHFVVSDPGFNGTTNRRVYVCNDGSVYRTENIYTASTSSGWTRLDLGMRTTQYYGAQGDGPTGRIIGGLQDNGTLRLSNGSNSANLMFGGDGGFCAIDPTNANYCYGEYVALTLHRSTDGGVSSNWIYSGIADANANANFIAPFILDPNNANRMLAGGASLWRSNNVKAGTPTWAAIRPAGSDLISAIAVARGNSDIVWVAQNNGEVWKTTNGTAVTPTWTAVDNNGGSNPFPNRYVTRILVDPADANTVYVALGGFSPDNLWKTTNGGTSWVDVTGTGVTGLPDAPIRGVARHPNAPNWLYVGTEIGLFESRNGGTTWSTNAFGPANVSVDEVSFMHASNTLLAATHGRGIWTASIANPAGNITGTVSLGDWVGAVAGQQVTFEVMDTGTSTVQTTATATLGVGGTYSMNPNVPIGTYDVYVKASHWLRKARTTLSLTAGGVTGIGFTVTNGDIDGDNEVGIGDYGILSVQYGTTNPQSDLNGDGEVDIADYSILSTHYGQVGD